MPEFLSSVAWLAISISILLPLQGWVARRTSEIFVHLTGDPRLALKLYSVLFFPGVFLHEASHWLAALVLGVRTGRFSLRPRLMRDGRYRLGYVEIDRVDPVRGALIGAAPLLAGTAVLLVIGFKVLHLDDVAWAAQQQAWQTALDWGQQVFRRPLAALWIYLALAVGQTMLPSGPDRRAWLAVGALIGAAGLLAIWAGLGPRLSEWFLPPIASGLRTLASAFTVTIALDLALAIPLILLGALVRASPRRRRFR